MPIPKKKVVDKKSVKVVAKAAPKSVPMGARKVLPIKRAIRKAPLTTAPSRQPVTKKPAPKRAAPKNAGAPAQKNSSSMISLARELIDKILAQKQVKLPSAPARRQVVTRKISARKAVAPVRKAPTSKPANKGAKARR